MKKMSFIQFIFTICCLFTTTLGMAQGLIVAVTDGHGGGTGDCIGRIMLNLDDESNATIYAPRLVLTNLVQINGISNVYTLPSGTPPMFWELTYDGTTITSSAIDIFSPHTPQGANPAYDYYLSRKDSLTLNFDHICSSDRQGSVVIGQVQLEYTWRLVDASGNDYPIALYSQPTDVFSCEAFPETCGHCTRSRCTSDPIEVLVDTTLACVECLSSNNAFDRDDKKDTEAAIQQFDVASTILLSPNPFQEELRLEYQVIRGNQLNIRIFNAQGQQIARFERQEQEGRIRQVIDTSNWSHGVYFFKIESPQQSRVLKLIKTKE
ncbi:MAG: T9SS type A sorting domain-containing protein [Bacteroidota bacterium]